DHISNQGINGSRNDNAVDDRIHEEDRNVNMNNSQSRCSYKEFMACKPKEFDGKGGTIAYTCWDEKMEAVQDISGCGDNQKVKYSITTEAPTIKSAILKARVLTVKAVKKGSLKRSGERRGDGEESSKEGNVKGDNKRAKTEKVFATFTNPVRKEYKGSAPRCTNCNFHHNLEAPCCICTNYNCLRHFSRDCRSRPMMVNPLNAKNLTAARGACYECGAPIITSQHALD
nr:reverse transcriptase domain-containing protein [Tanacetum cinerariifolium]